MQVKGHLPDGTAWEEMTTTLDASFGGASFKLKRPIESGQVVLLALPLPKAFRRYDLSDPSYRTYALVRSTFRQNNEQRVGVFFLGRTPPKGYSANPGGRYLLPHDPKPKVGEEAREFPRFQVFVTLKIQRSQVGSQPAEEEHTVAEDLSKHGARVMTSMKIQKGEVVTIQEVGGSFRTRAEVRNIAVGRDGILRLGLQFEKDVPERLISS